MFQWYYGSCVWYNNENVEDLINCMEVMWFV